MTWRPKPGDRVQVRCKDHGHMVEGRIGTVIYAGENDTVVEFPDRHRARVPNEHLMEIKEKP